MSLTSTQIYGDICGFWIIPVKTFKASLDKLLDAWMSRVGN